MSQTSNTPIAKNKKPLAIITAGGTGGHVFPGLSIAERLQEKGWDVRWIGSKEGMEAKLVTDRNIEFDAITIVGLRGKGIIRFLLLPMIILRAFYSSFKLLRKLKPDIIIGMGGYVAFAPPMVAAALGIPVVIHEQNAVGGLVNKVLNPIADLRFSAFPNTLSGAQCCGNPVLKKMLAVEEPQVRFTDRDGPLTILIVGGSRGAGWLNQTLPQVLSALPQIKKMKIIHQAGSAQAATLAEQYKEQGINAEVRPFIEDMSAAYGQADLVISRAGAMTVTELACIGVASILIPFPHAVDDHQYANATYLAKQKAAYLFRQNEIRQAEFVALLARLTRQDCLDMAIKARKLSVGDAAETIALACDNMIKRKKM